MILPAGMIDMKREASLGGARGIQSMVGVKTSRLLRACEPMKDGGDDTIR